MSRNLAIQERERAEHQHTFEPGPGAAHHDHFASHLLTGSNVGRLAGRRSRRRRGVRNPWVHAAVMTLAFAASVVVLVLIIGASEKSAYTQAHGTAVVATVESVDNTTSCSRHGGCSTSFTADVDLQTPVGGHTFTTVHGQNSFPGADGEQLSVLVDPHDPSYAELRGNEDTPGSDVIFGVIAVGVLGFLMLAAILRVVRRSTGLLPGRARLSL